MKTAPKGAVFVHLIRSDRLGRDPVADGFAAPALRWEFEALGRQLLACMRCCLFESQVYTLLFGQRFFAGGFHGALRCNSCHLAWS